MNCRRPVGITGIGVYAPEKILTNFDLEKMVETTDEWITVRTGIKERRIAAENESTSDVAYQAGKKALENSRVNPEEVDLLIVCTCTPDKLIPSTACMVQDKLGLKNAAAFDLNAGCTGFIYGISLAGDLVGCGSYNTIMVIGAETLSKVIDWQDRNTCVLFGDGAGAAIVQPVEEGYGFLGHILRSDGSGADMIEIPAGGSRLPTSHQTVDERLHFIRMKGKEVFKFAVSVFESVSRDVLDKAGIPMEDIKLVVPHQANNRILEAAAKRMKIPNEKMFSNLERFGNTSAASVPLALSEALEEGKIKKGDYVLLVGFGAGLTHGAIVMKWAY